MLNTTCAANNLNTLSMHHDLWVELARVEMSMEDLGHDAVPDVLAQKKLEKRSADLLHAMRLLPE